MGGSKYAASKSKLDEYHAHSGYERLEAMDDMLRQEYRELVLEHDELQNFVKSQDKEIATYKKIVSETSSIELSRRIDEIQDQLRQILATLDRSMSENARMIKELNKRPRHTSSIHSSLHPLSHATPNITEESGAYKEDTRLIADKLTRSEAQEIGSATQYDEKVPSKPSRIHRKKAISNLRSREVETDAPQLRGRHEQLVHSRERPTDDLLVEIATTRAEFLALQSKLKSAETHIINVGGNLGALLSPDTVKQEFTSLLIATQTWVTTCVLPSISDIEQCLQASKRARNVWASDTALRISRMRNQDFCAASKFPRADESIFLVMIFDLLVENVLSAKVMYLDHGLQREIDVIKQLGPSMKQNSESTKRLYNARRWMSEALTAILSREETQALRDDFSHIMAHFITRTLGLPEILGPANPAALDAATISIRRDVILPAIELGEKMACAIDKYTLGFSPYWSEPCVFQTQFFRDLGKLDCKNLGDGPPRFRLEKMQKQLTDDEIRNQLKAICPATPALILTEVDDSTWGPPTILVCEQVWVSWDSRALTRVNDEQGFFWHLYSQEASQHEK